MMMEIFHPTFSIADIHYYIQHKGDKVHISANFDYSKDNEISLYIPDLIWGTDYTKQIKNIRVKKQNKIISLNKIGGASIEYDIVNLPLEEFQDSFADRYYHYYDRNNFYLIGHGLFIYPKDLEKSQVKATIHFDSNFYNKISVNIPPYKLEKNNITLSLSDLNNLIIVGNGTIAYPDDQTTLITWPVNTTKQEHVNFIAASIIKEQNDFWEVKAVNKSIVIINDPKPSNINHCGGMWLKNTIVLFIDPNINSETDLINIISHENLHSWFGSQGLLNGEQWFREGFTTYYVDKIAYKLNKDHSTFLDNYNHILYLYFSSPFRELQNKVIEETFFKIHALEKLPYWKGYLIAGQIDSIIDLDSLLRDIFRNCRNSEEKCFFSYDFLLKYLPSDTPDSTKKQIRNIINNFSSEILTKRFLAKKGELSYKQLSVEKYPFDIIEILTSGLINGKDLNLSEDMNYKIDDIWNDPKGDSYVSIFVEGVKKDIRLKMSKINIKIPFYHQ